MAPTLGVKKAFLLCFLLRFKDAYHVSGVGHEEVLSHVSRKQVEKDSLVVQLHLLHVVPLLFRLDMPMKVIYIKRDALLSKHTVIIVGYGSTQVVIAYFYH